MGQSVGMALSLPRKVSVLGSTGSAVHTALWTREDSRSELGQWLLRLLGQEYRLRGRSHLH